MKSRDGGGGRGGGVTWHGIFFFFFLRDPPRHVFGMVAAFTLMMQFHRLPTSRRLRVFLLPPPGPALIRV